MSLLSSLQLLTAFGIIISAAWLMRSHPRPRLSSAYFVLAAVWTGWLVALALTVGANDQATAERWARGAVFVAFLGPAAIHSATSASLGAHPRAHQAVAIWVASVFAGLLALGSELFVNDVTSFGWGWFPDLGPAAALLPIAIVVTAVIGATRISLTARRAGLKADRDRTRQLLPPVAFALPALIDLLPGYGVAVPPLGFVFLGAAASLSFLAVRRHARGDTESAFHPETLMEAMQEAVFAVDLRGRVSHANRAASELFRISSEELRGTDISELIRTPFNVGPASHSLMSGRSFEGRPMVFERRGGGGIEVSVSGSILRDSAGMPTGQLYVAKEISDEAHAKQLSYRAFHDPLTGLPNRSGFMPKIDDLSETVVMTGRTVSVIVVDVDRFALINGTRGAAVGDALIREISSRLRDALRGGDVLARIGPDRFGVLIDMARPSDIELVITKLRAVFEAPFQLEGDATPVTACFGIAHLPIHADNGEDLFHRAETALRAAKKQGTFTVQIFGEEIEAEINNIASVQTRLRKAVENGDLELHYQPIVELRDEGIVGCEALIRWRDGDDLVLPSDFIGIAEEYGIIGEMGAWTLREACNQVAEWTHRLEPVRMSVNLSVSQLEDREFLSELEEILADAEVPPELIELEITESSAMRDGEFTRKNLMGLESMGIGIALDDFGTGYASMAYLQRLPISKLKIDQSFVAELSRSRSASAIVSATIAMADAMKLEVTAEGIENRFQFAFLHMERCHYGQGFGISPPLTAGEFETFFRTPVAQRSVRTKGDTAALSTIS